MDTKEHRPEETRQVERDKERDDEIMREVGVEIDDCS